MLSKNHKKKLHQLNQKKKKAKAETETEVEQQSETQQEETQEVAEQEEASQDENAIEEQETNLHQVIVNGEKIDVDLEELKAGYQKDADYRRKTEELAIEKRELRAEEDRLKKPVFNQDGRFKFFSRYFEC